MQQCTIGPRAAAAILPASVSRPPRQGARRTKERTRPLHLFPIQPSGALATALVAVILLLPGPSPLPRREADRDVAGLRQTECEYRGIKASFDELTRVYVLQVYDGGRLVRWEARPNPRNPEGEALVTAVFAVSRPKAVQYAVTPELTEQRQAAAPELAVTWRYCTLASLQVYPGNEYAADAVTEYRRTVDGFVARMVVVGHDAELRQGPGAEHPPVGRVTGGTVLLLEADADPASTWAPVRIPSSPTTGWVERDNLRAVADVR